MDKHIKEMYDVSRNVEEMERKMLSALHKFVESKGGFIQFEIDPKQKYPDCPIVRLIDLIPPFSRTRTESAFEYLVYALRTNEEDVEFYASQFMETYTETITREEMESKDNEDNWRSLQYSEDVIYYDTLDKICEFLIDFYES